jgi:hypothetical protein
MVVLVGQAVEEKVALWCAAEAGDLKNLLLRPAAFVV